MMDFWTWDKMKYQALEGDIKCTVAVVGGGLTGALVAYRLASRGVDTVLFEEKTIASGKTSRSTAKVTVAHGTAYSEIEKRLSMKTAKKYAAANLAGLRVISEFCGEDGMRDMYLYALYGERRLRCEYEVMRACEIDADYLSGEEVPLPFPVKGAIRVRGQYAVNPTQLVYEICRRGKFKIFENSPAREITRHGFSCLGHRVRADFVVVATNYPVHIQASLAPIRLSGKSSVAVAFSSKSGFSMPDVMAYGADGGYAYDGVKMFYVEKYGAYAVLVRGAVTLEMVDALLSKATGCRTLAQTYDVNCDYVTDGVVDLKDATAIYACASLDFAVENYMDLFLRSDVNGDHVLNMADINLVTANYTK